jgi:hypothetical protein
MQLQSRETSGRLAFLTLRSHEWLTAEEQVLVAERLAGASFSPERA